MSRSAAFVGSIVADVSVSNLSEFPEPDFEFTTSSDIWHDQPAQLLPAGTAGSAAIVFAALQGKCTLAGVIGKDSMGDYLTKHFDERGIATFPQNYGQTATHIIANGIDGRRQSYFFPGSRMSLETFTEVCRDKPLFFSGLSLVMDRPIIEPLKQLASPAQQGGHTTVLDIGQAGPEMLKFKEIIELRDTIDILIGSEYEYELVLGQEYTTARQQLLSEYPGYVIVKRGPNGAYVDRHDKNRPLQIPGFQVNEINPIGAGDSFGGGFMAACIDGKDIESACEFACAVGAVSASNAAGPLGITSQSIHQVMQNPRSDNLIT